MSILSPELRWFVVAGLLGLAAVVSCFYRGRPFLLGPALLLSPLPAFLFLRLTSVAYAVAPPDQVSLGLALSALSCWLPPALGVLAVCLVERDAARPRALRRAAMSSPARRRVVRR